MAMIELEPVEAEEELMERLMGQQGDLESHGLVDVMSDMTKHDAERLYALVARHAHYTNSAKAKAILADWRTYLPKFKKVMPVEYRKALIKMAAVQAADKDGLEKIEIGLKMAKA
jgi:glutamate synthase (NADPH/NADH) large chain